MSEARSDSIYKRLEEAGKLDATFTALYKAAGEDSLRIPFKAFVAMERSLRLDGIATSPSALFDMVSTHGFAWRIRRRAEANREAGRTGDLATDARDAVQEQLDLLAFENLSLKELILLSKNNGGKDKIEILRSRLKLAENDQKRKDLEAERKMREAAAKLLATQLESAAFVDALLAEKERLEQIASLRKDSAAAGETAAQRIERIRTRMYGAQTQPEEQAA